jgi:hypothetical protein
MNRTMTGVLAITAVVAMSACSSDKIAESIAERQIEKETGGDADIDLSDGQFSIETEDGAFQMSADEDGNVVVKSEDADGNEVVSIDSEDGVTEIQTEDGDATITNDGDGNVSVESDQGDATISSNDGEVQIDTGDGTATFASGGELPDGFPDLPMPDDMTIVLSQQSGSGADEQFVVVSTAPGDWESYLDEVTGFLESNGYTQQSITETPDGAYFLYVDADGTTLISGGVGPDPSSGGMTLNLAVGPN